jgi:hypothetical protein
VRAFGWFGDYGFFLNWLMNMVLLHRMSREWRKAGAAAEAPMSARTVLFRPQNVDPHAPADLGWSARCPNLTVCDVGGDHNTMFDEPDLSFRFTAFVATAAENEIRRQMPAAIEAQDAAHASVLEDLLKDHSKKYDALIARLHRQAEAERQAAVARVELTLTAERNAVASRIRELETDLESHRKAAAAQAAEFQREAEAEREATVARIRELETDLESHRKAAAAQVAEFQRQAEAERQAAVARIEELVVALNLSKIGWLAATAARATSTFRMRIRSAARR